MNTPRRLRFVHMVSLAWLASLVMATVCPSAAMAAERGASQRAMAFLLLGAGPRAYGMGEAFAGVADDATAASWNPAGLAQIPRVQSFFMHNQWFGNLRQEFFITAIHLSKGVAAVQACYWNPDQQLRVDQDGEVTGDSFHPYSLLAGAGYALPLGSGFLAGGVVNYAREQLDDVIYQTVASDWGLICRPDASWWSLGLSVQNIGQPVAGYPLPLTARLGMAARTFNNNLLATAEAARTFPGEFRYSLGVELWALNFLALRTGYIYRPEFEGLGPLSGLRAGAGLKVLSLQLDYAVSPQGELGIGHRASLTCFF